MSHKLVNVTWATALTAAVAGMSHLVGTVEARALAVAVVVALALGAVALTHHVTRRAAVVASLSYDSRVAITRWVTAGAALHVTWVVVVVAARPDLLARGLLALLVLALIEYQAARGLNYLLTRPPVTRPVVTTPTVEATAAVTRTAALDPATVSLADARAHFVAALKRARLGWLRVTDVTPIQGGWRFEVLVTSAAQEGRSGTAKTLGAGNAEAIALALREVLGIRLMTSWVQVTSAGYAGEYHVSVVTEDRRAAVIPYTEDPVVTATSITVPCPIGYQLDGTLVAERLDQHGQTIGKSRWGKSSLAHRKAAHLTRCVDAEWWVGGTEKLYDLVGGWLAPYEGLDRKSPIDYVAYGLPDLLEMLVGAMRLARYRQRVPLAKRRPWHKVIITLDEASFALENTSLKVTYDGKRRTAAELVAMLNKGGGSGEVYVHTYNQRGTNDQLGDQGGTIKANSGFVEVFSTQDPDELGRAFGNWKLARLRHKGEFWVNVGEAGDGEVVNLKGEYLQEVDPARDHLHDGLTVSDVAWARRDLIREEPLDAAERAAVGDAYVRRHRTADAQVEYLTGEPPVDGGDGEVEVSDDETAGYVDAMTALDAVLGPRDEASTVIRPAAPRESPELWDRVVRALNERPGTSVKDLIAFVAADGRGPIDGAEVEAAFQRLFDEEVPR